MRRLMEEVTNVYISDWLTKSPLTTQLAKLLLFCTLLLVFPPLITITLTVIIVPFREKRAKMIYVRR